jgi:hypothetical protein
MIKMVPDDISHAWCISMVDAHGRPSLAREAMSLLSNAVEGVGAWKKLSPFSLCDSFEEESPFLAFKFK